MRALTRLDDSTVVRDFDFTIQPRRHMTRRPLPLLAIAVIAAASCATTRRPDQCPASSGSTPLAQLAAQSERFDGCSVSTEFSLSGPFVGNERMGTDCVEPNHALFIAGHPDAAPVTAGATRLSYMALVAVPDAQAAE